MKQMSVVKAALLSTICLATVHIADAVALKASSCNPPCSEHGLCIENRCFCRSPYGGPGCHDVINKALPQADDRGGAAAVPGPDASAAAAAEDSGDDLFGRGDGASDQETDAPADGPGSARSQEGPLLKVEAADLGSENGGSKNDPAFSEDSLSSDTDSPPATEQAQVQPMAVPPPSPALRASLAEIPAAPASSATSWWPAALGSLNGFWQKVRPDAEQPSSAPTGGDFSERPAAPARPRAHSILRGRQEDRRSTRSPTILASGDPMPRLSALSRGSYSITDACIPWLAELRSADLRNATHSEGSVSDMKSMRLLMFKARIGGGQGLKKQSFHSQMGRVHKGPAWSEANALFTRLDVSGDDMLSFEEYNAENLCGFRRSVLEVLGARQESFLQAFRLLDTDRNGELQEQEFIQTVSGPLLGLTESNAAHLFQLADWDGTPGVITRKEFQQVGALPRLRAEVMDKEPDRDVAFKQADKNADGILDADEFAQHAMDMGDFENGDAAAAAKAELDKNNDGAVSSDEYLNKCWFTTGGICGGLQMCAQWRGPVYCYKGSSAETFGACNCFPGFCAKNGMCVPEELHSKNDTALGPEAHAVLKKMQKVDISKIGSSTGSVNPAAAVGGVLVGIALVGQLKLALSAWPGLGVIVFGLSVCAFCSVTVTCFRAYSVPKTLNNTFQVVMMSLVFLAVTLSMTSLVRIFAPRSSKVVSVCWYAHDDADDYGLDLGEEKRVRAYNLFQLVVSYLCVIGLWFLPLTGADGNTKGILIMLYLFIVILDSSMLDLEVKQCSNRRLLWDLTLKSGDDIVRIDCLAAWWNFKPAGLHDEGDPDWAKGESIDVSGLGGKKKPQGPAQGNVSKFETYRKLSLQDGGVASSSQPPKASKWLGSNEEAIRASAINMNQVHFAAEYSGLGDEGMNYVYGRVVLCWEDTALELVIPQGPDSDGQGTSWIAVDPSSEDPAKTLAPKDDSGAYLWPWLRAQEGGEENQSIQRKMSLVAQAGGTGLIIGQRGIDHLSCKPFGEGPEAARHVWQGNYYGRHVRSLSSDPVAEVQKTPDDFMVDFVSDVSIDTVPMGCAVNTVVINSMDMQELRWAVEEREALLQEEKERPRAGGAPDDDLCRAKVPITAFECRRKKQNLAVASSSEGQSEVQKFALCKDKETVAFRHVFDHQRTIMALVSPKAESTFSFLEGIRVWVMSHPFTQARPYYAFFHLFLTALVLQVVLEMALMLYRSLLLNGQGRFAASVFLPTLMNGLNSSYYLDWWPTYILQKEKRYGLKKKDAPVVSQTVGALFTSLLLLEYFGVACALFGYYGIYKVVVE